MQPLPDLSYILRYLLLCVAGNDCTYNSYCDYLIAEEKETLY